MIFIQAIIVMYHMHIICIFNCIVFISESVASLNIIEIIYTSFLSLSMAGRGVQSENDIGV